MPQTAARMKRVEIPVIRYSPESPDALYDLAERIIVNHYLHVFDEATPCWMRLDGMLAGERGKGIDS